MSSEILNFTEVPTVDESIEKYEFHEYEPVARTNLNTAGEIRINIELQDLFTHPAESYLQFEGRRWDCIRKHGRGSADKQWAYVPVFPNYVCAINPSSRISVLSRTSNDNARHAEVP